MISFVLFPQASPPSMNFNIIYPNWSITSTKTKWKNVLPQNMCVFIAQYKLCHLLLRSICKKKNICL